MLVVVKDGVYLPNRLKGLKDRLWALPEAVVP
jgi:hypothetical protein